jgi:hypothetical protein
VKKEIYMPRVAASNGVRPEIRALAVIKLGVPVTPAEINTHVGTGDYAAKYISFLNTRYGFTITTQKDGRRVVSYTLIAEPENAATLRASQPKAPKTKAPKTVKLTTVVAKVSKEFAAKKAASAAPAPVKAKAAKRGKSVADIKAANLAKLKAVGAKFKAEKIEALTEEPAATSFSIDGDWDSFDGVDLKNLL